MNPTLPVLNYQHKSIPIEHISFDANLIKELKNLGVLKPNKKCIYILKLNENLEALLRDRIKRNITETYFQYGQLLLINNRYEDAMYYFNYGASHCNDLQCMYQMGVMYYSGLGCTPDSELACGYMKQILEMKHLPEAQHLIYAASYNLGRAYYVGHGVKQSVEKAIYRWLFAADNGSPIASVHAQTILGYFYSTPDYIDIDKAVFWHSEACSNGSIQSQAVLGVMYFLGIGKSVDLNSTLICLRQASERGDVYAKGMLCYFYYTRKLYTSAADLASKLIMSTPERTSNESDSYRKGLAIANFIYARCLNFGFGVQQNSCLSQIFNKKSYSWNADVTHYFRRLVGTGEI